MFMGSYVMVWSYTEVNSMNSTLRNDTKRSSIKHNYTLEIYSQIVRKYWCQQMTFYPTYSEMKYWMFPCFDKVLLTGLGK